jgi:hypothetical protein
MNKLHIEKGKCIYLRWVDSAAGHHGWVYDDLKPVIKEVETVAFVVAVNKRGVLLTSTRSGTGGVISPLSIPLGCILEVKHIEV